MVMLGTFILAFGWFGFNPGSTLSGTDNRIAIIAVNTMLASASGALFSTLVMMWKFGKPDPSMICNGMLAGLVAITAPCAFVNSLGAVIVGAVAGVLVVASVFFVEQDPEIGRSGWSDLRARNLWILGCPIGRHIGKWQLRSGMGWRPQAY